MSSTDNNNIILQSKPKRERTLSKRQAEYHNKHSRENSNGPADGEEQDLCWIGPREEIPPIPRKFEYGDHTADIILHGYGLSIEESFESMTYAMICYMFDHPERTTINPLLTHTISITGNSIPDLVFRYLTEVLVQSINYHDDLSADVKAKLGKVGYPGMIPRLVRVLHFSEVKPTELLSASESSKQGSTFKLEVEIQGNFIDTVKLGAGTEVKAITNELTRLETLTDEEEIRNKGGKFHIQVLVDICYTDSAESDTHGAS